MVTGRQNVRLVLTGQSGTGKSTMLRWMLATVMHLRRRSTVLLLDHKSDHWPFLKAWGFSRLELGPEQARRPINWAAVQKQYPFLFVHADGLLESERVKLADTLGWNHLHTPASLLIVEECSYYYPAVGKRPEGLERLANAGRASGSDLWLVCQRLQDVHPKGLSAANYIISFRLREPNSRRKAGELLGAGREVEQDLASLPNFTYLESDVERGLLRRGKTPGPL